MDTGLIDNQLKISDCWSSKQKYAKTSKKDKSVCPMCNQTLWNNDSLDNLHIDLCLQKCESKANKIENEGSMPISPVDYEHSSNFLANEIVELPGLYLIYNFVSEEEECSLEKQFHNNTLVPWKHSSFNGHCLSKYFGVRTQFGLPNEIRLVRQNDISQGEYPLPEFCEKYIDRLQRAISENSNRFPSELRSFRPTDCNVNYYEREKGDFLRPHFDDRALSGPILMNLSLSGAADMIYSNPYTNNIVSVHLPRRCLQLVTGPARWSFMHEIKAESILDSVRLSITWRQSGGKHGVQQLSEEGSNYDIATRLLQKSSF